MNEIRSNPVKFLEEHLILNTQRYAHHDETSLITVNITREDGLLRLKETEYDMAGSDYILFTAMRDTDSPERFDAPAVVSLSNQWICPYISRHLLSLTPSLAHCRRYS
ncbi:hypothetical protein, partial [Escherichia coli]|uniref:hypothetical protein n=1 Tax=Escherichia coli TaxID=562 RepID=UPI000AF3F593